MGETTNPQGDVATQTQTGVEGQTPQETPTFTQEQVDKLVAKAKSDATSDYKRLETEFKRSRDVGEAALNRLKTIEEEQLRKEEEECGDDPEKLSAVLLKRQAVKAKNEAEDALRKAEAKEAENQTHLQEIKGHRAERLAEKYAVDSATILRFGGETKESMEELAKSYGERKPTGESEATLNNRMTETPDSGKTKGSSGAGYTPTLEQLRASTPEETEKKVKSGEWVIPGWQA